MIERIILASRWALIGRGRATGMAAPRAGIVGSPFKTAFGRLSFPSA